jgi:hypothetical protein
MKNLNVKVFTLQTELQIVKVKNDSHNNKI